MNPDQAQITLSGIQGQEAGIQGQEVKTTFCAYKSLAFFPSNNVALRMHKINIHFEKVERLVFNVTKGITPGEKLSPSV